MGPVATHCSEHPGVPTQVQCLGCERWLCEPCVKVVTARRAELEVCAHCGGVVHDFGPPPPEAIEDLRALPGMLTTQTALATAVTLAIPVAVADFPLLMPVLIFYVVGVATWFLAITDHTARGRPGLPGLDDGPWTNAGFGQQIARGVALVVVVLAPYLLWTFAVVGPDDTSTTGALVGWALLLVGLTYAPAAVIAMVLARATLASAWVPAWIRIVNTDRRSYAELAGQVMGAGLVWIVIEALGDVLLGWLWVIGPLVVTTASNLAVFAMAMLIGRWVRRHRRSFGMRTPTELR